MAKVIRTMVTTLEVDGKKAETYSLNIGQVKKLLAGEDVELIATDHADFFDTIRLCNVAKDDIAKGRVKLDVIGKSR